NQVVRLQRRWQQAAIATDLTKWRRLGRLAVRLAGSVGWNERQMIETRIRSVNHPKAIFTRFNFEKRRCPPIHADGIAKKLLHPHWVSAILRRRISKRAIDAETAVLDHQRNFV